MDTSITIALVVGVLFVFTLPSLLRRIDGAAQRTEIDQIPAAAHPCEPAAPASCSTPAEGPSLFAGSREAASYQPPMLVPVTDEAPELHLVRETPALSVIDGQNASEQAEQQAAEFVPLPVAVGQHYSAHQYTAHHDQMDTPMKSSQSSHVPGAPMSQHTKREFPAHLRSRLTDAQSFAGSTGSAGPGADGSRAAAVGSTGSSSGARPESEAATPRVSGRSARHAQETRTGSSARGRSTARPAQQTSRADEAHEESAGEVGERIAQLKSVIPLISIVFLLVLAGSVVTAVLALFGAVPWAVPVLTVLLAAGCLFMVRSLNLRVRALRRELREATRDRGQAVSGSRTASGRSTAAETISGSASRARADASSQDTVAPRSAAERRAGAALAAAADRRRARTEPEPGASRPRAGSVSAEPAPASAAASAPASADTEAPSPDQRETVDLTAVREAVVAASKPAPSEAPEKPTMEKPAPGKPTMEKPAPGKPTMEKPTTSEAPAATGSHARTAAQTPTPRSAGNDDSTVRVQRAQRRPALSLGAEDAPAAPSRTNDPLAKRFAATGWNPTPVPKPTYVEAPVVERTQRQQVEPDVSSTSLPAHSKESLAEMFAEELGYRAELEDPVREDSGVSESALTHGRAAIGANRRGVGRIDDVLARRRA
ncbi:hypothetical protein GCM10022261_05960 [Brevibacterium daeguense]|uniref:Uncharacterized protein n=1 Tax=Brevibacterium daeguense TaxID=909936 RepID=A0ABP8EGR9_9MICO|nr:hypothetical protein [Brevibacterium daeguense]